MLRDKLTGGRLGERGKSRGHGAGHGNLLARRALDGLTLSSKSHLVLASRPVDMRDAKVMASIAYPLETSTTILCG
jgi:hypothetical protein